MSLVRLMLAAIIALTLIAGVMPTEVSAETSAKQNQKLEEEVTVECTAGSYGQSSTCKASGKVLGEQSQEIRTRNGVKVMKKYLDTGMDTPSTIAFTSVLGIGAVAALAKVKNRIA